MNNEMELQPKKNMLNIDVEKKEEFDIENQTPTHEVHLLPHEVQSSTHEVQSSTHEVQPSTHEVQPSTHENGNGKSEFSLSPIVSFVQKTFDINADNTYIQKINTIIIRMKKDVVDYWHKFK